MNVKTNYEGSQSGNVHELDLRYILSLNWLMLAALAVTGWVTASGPFVKGIVVGGIIANISFVLLRRDLIRGMSGPLKVVKIRFFVNYYARFAVLAVLLFLIIKNQFVDSVGLLIGLSTVVLSIGATVLGQVKKIYFHREEAL